MKKLLHLRHYLLIGLVFIILGFGNKAIAAGTAYVWVGTTSDWTTTSNWNPVGTPTSADGVTINAVTSPKVYPTITTGQTVAANNLTIASTATLNMTGGTFNFYHDWKNSGTFNGTGGTVVFSGNNGGGAWPSATAVDQFYNVTIATGITEAIDKSGTIKVAGNWVNSGTATITNCTIEFNGSTSQTISGNGTTFNNLTISNTNVAGVALGVNSNVSAALNVKAGSTLNLSTFSLGSPTSLALECGATGSTISGSGTLTLGGNVSVAKITGTGAGALISCPVALGATRTFDVADETTTVSDLTMSGIISGAFGITKSTGTGQMYLSNANTFTGAVTINAGTLIANTLANASTTSSLGTGAGTPAIAIGASGTLKYNGTGGHSSTRVITISGSGATIDASGTGTAVTFGGNITGTNTNLILTGTGSGSISSVVALGSGTLNKSGTGTWTLSGANSYTGITTVSAGTLVAGASVTSGSTSPFGNSSTAIVLGDAATTTNNSSPTLLNGGAYTMARPVTIANQSTSGTYSLGGNTDNTSTFSGAITINQQLTVSQIATTSTNTLSITGGITTGNAGTKNVTFDNAGSVSVTTTAITKGTGDIALIKQNSGTLTLSTINTFTAGSTLSTGTLNINNSQALGTAAGTFIINGGTIDNTTGSAITTLNYPQTWGGDFVFTGFKDLNLGTGAVTLGADRQVTVTAGTLTVGGVISDNSKSLNKAGAGTLSFGSQAVTLKDLTISGGLFTSTSTTLNLAGNFSNSGTFTHNSGTVNFNGAGQTISGGTGAFNNITLSGSGTKTIETAASGTLASGTLNIDQTGGASAIASVTNTNIGVNNLKFSNIEQVAGSWGYGAGTPPTYKNTTFFASTSGYLNVTSGSDPLDHFAISTISSPTTAGTAVTGITLTAKDNIGNTVTSFSGTVVFSGTAGITGTSASFTDGVLSGVSITPTVAGSGKTFVVTASAKTGTATFDVNPGALNNFLVEASAGGNIGTQNAGSAFTIKVTARDANNNTCDIGANAFTGAVDITSNGTLTAGSGTTASFVAGILSSHSVTLSPGISSATITATKTSGSETGTSNAFDLNNPAPTISSISPTSVCAGSGDFTLTVNGTNFNSSSVVKIAGTSRTTTLVDATQLTAAILAADVASAGTKAITVFNPTPGGGTSGSINLNVTASGTWIGGAAGKLTDWDEPTNWCGGAVPTSSTDVVIPNVTNKPVIGSTVTADCNALSIASGATLTIESSATSSGSLIMAGTYSGPGTVTYNRYMAATRWYIASAPVDVTSGFSSNNSVIHFDTNDSKYDFATYTEAGNAGWDYLAAIPAGLSGGKGYLVSLTAANSVQFTGAMNNGTVTPSVTSSEHNGWNGVGNPYTSAIGLTSDATSNKNFLTENSGVLSTDYGAIYVWNEDAGYSGSEQYYKAIGNSGYTPPSGPSYGNITSVNIQTGQGFMINANANTTVTFSKDMQLHDAALSLKSAKTSWPGVTLLATTGTQTRSAIVAFNESMTTGVDKTYDAGLLATDDFQLYTRLVAGGSTVNFEVQCLPKATDTQLSVPVGIELPAGGTVTFKAAGIILPAGYYAVLEDKVAKVSTPLKTETDTYTVSLPANTTGAGRLFLHIADGNLISDSPAALPVNKFSVSYTNGKIIVTGPAEAGAKASIYDILGRKVGEYPLLSNTINEIPDNGLAQRVYIVKIDGKSYKEVFKVLITK